MEGECKPRLVAPQNHISLSGWSRGRYHGAMPDSAPRTAVYARVSTSDQDVQMQVDELRVEAARRGWKIVGTYTKSSHIVLAFGGRYRDHARVCSSTEKACAEAIC